jgi:hypothetical protein
MLAVLAFFTAGCEPRLVWAVLQTASRVGLLSICAGAAAAFFVVSKRRKQILLGVAALAAGFVVGDFPQWRAWLLFGIPPTAAVLPSCPTQALPRARLIAEQLLPAAWGIPFLPDILRQPSALQVCLWVVILLVVVAAVAAFVWYHRRAFLAFVSLSPLSNSGMGPVVIGLIFFAPLTLAAVGSNTVNMFSARYLLITWQASAVVLGVFVSRLLAKLEVKGLGLLFLVMWGFAAVTNLNALNDAWSMNRNLYAPQAVAALEGFLRDQQVRFGYADYWIAYTVDFLTEERITIAPYNAIDRYPAYSAAVQAQPIQAYVLQSGMVKPETRDVEDLIRAASGNWSGGPIYPQVVERLRNQKVLDRQRVANWDVWVVADR